MADEQALLEAAGRVDAVSEPGQAADLYENLVQASWVSARGRATAAYHLGLCRRRQSDWPAAIAALEIAASGFEDQALGAIARLDLAEVLMKSGAPNVALGWFERLLLEGVPQTLSRPHVLLRYVACQLAAGEKPAEISSDELPKPGEAIPEATAGAWFEAAHSFEVANDLAAAAQLYKRLLDRPGLPPVVEVNAHFRCGFASEARLDWKISLEHYEKCVDAPRVYPLAQDLARLQLANLLYASEDYHRAARHYEILKFADELTVRQQAQARLRHARCLISGGDPGAGERELVLCRGLYPESDASVQADLLLADIYGGREDHGAAAACYRRVIENPYAEPSVKALARMCILQLPPL